MTKNILLLMLISAIFVTPVCAYLGMATYTIEFDSKEANTMDRIKQAVKDNGLPCINGYEDENARLDVVLLIDSEKTESFKKQLETISNTVCPIKNVTLTDFDNSAVCIF